MEDGGSYFQINDPYRQGIVVDTREAYSLDISQKVKIVCPDMMQNGVGLWQFIVASHSGDIKVFSLHTVCRYGNLYNKPPNCPWNACLNADCSGCAFDWTQGTEDSSLNLAAKITDTDIDTETESERPGTWAYAGFLCLISVITLGGAVLAGCQKRPLKSNQEPLL